MKDLDRQRLDQIAADLLTPFAQARGPGMTIGVLQDDELSFASDRTRSLGTELEIRPFQDDDAPQVRELFIATNRLLSPPDLRGAFEAYIERALKEEIDRIAAYYRELPDARLAAAPSGGADSGFEADALALVLPVLTVGAPSRVRLRPRDAASRARRPQSPA